MFTVANLLCGYYAILATLEGGVTDLDNAARAIGIAIVFDSLDGRVARAMGTNSEFGKQFDSLADVVSFGMAPAFLAYAWGSPTRWLQRARRKACTCTNWAGWLASSIWAAARGGWRGSTFKAWRRAAAAFSSECRAPAAAGMIAATVHFFRTPISDARLSVLWLALLMVLGALMSSTVRHYSFKDIQWTRRRPSLVVVLLALSDRRDRVVLRDPL